MASCAPIPSTLPVTTAVLTANGGTLTAGSQGSAKFPRLDDTSPAQRAVVTVTSRDNTDPLSPGTDDFTFGAEFWLNYESDGVSLDNGNNLVQRGLYADPAQYKVQVDHDHVSCRVAGSDGAVVAKSAVVVDPHTWYRTTCARSGDRLQLTVLDEAAGTLTRTTVSGPIGSVDPGAASVPLAIGGKVTSSGTLVIGSSDQFNGLVDDVFYDAPTG